MFVIHANIMTKTRNSLTAVFRNLLNSYHGNFVSWYLAVTRRKPFGTHRSINISLNELQAVTGSIFESPVLLSFVASKIMISEILRFQNGPT